MSYILEALKKADQERNRGEVPDISTSHMGMLPERGFRGPILWLVGGLLLINLIFLYLYFTSRAGPPTPQVESTAQPVTPSSPVLDTPPAVPLAAKPTGRSSVAPESGVPVKVVEMPDPPVRIVLPPPSQAPPPVPSAREATAAIAVAPARLPQSPPAAVPDEVPVWQSASSAAKMFAAGLSLDIHVYAERPKQRFVLINMVKYREGDELRDGGVLQRITETGVVLQYRGEEFRIDRQ